MRLNNKGWGLSSFIMFLCIFFIALLILVIVGNDLSCTSKRDPVDLIENANG